MEEKDLIRIGKIARFQGNKGEVRIIVDIDDPDRLLSLVDIPVFIYSESKTLTEMHLEYIKPYKDFILFKFKEINSLGDAKSINGKELFMREEDLWELPTDEYYVDALIGLKVFSEKDEQYLGDIADILETAADDLLLVKKEKNSFYVPMNSYFVREIDLKNGLVKINAIDGLVDLNKNQ